MAIELKSKDDNIFYQYYTPPEAYKNILNDQKPDPAGDERNAGGDFAIEKGVEAKVIDKTSAKEIYDYLHEKMSELSQSKVHQFSDFNYIKSHDVKVGEYITNGKDFKKAEEYKYTTIKSELEKLILDRTIDILNTNTEPWTYISESDYKKDPKKVLQDYFAIQFLTFLCEKKSEYDDFFKRIVAWSYGQPTTLKELDIIAMPKCYRANAEREIDIYKMFDILNLSLHGLDVISSEIFSEVNYWVRPNGIPSGGSNFIRNIPEKPETVATNSDLTKNKNLPERKYLEFGSIFSGRYEGEASDGTEMLLTSQYHPSNYIPPKPAETKNTKDAKDKKEEKETILDKNAKLWKEWMKGTGKEIETRLNQNADSYQKSLEDFIKKVIIIGQKCDCSKYIATWEHYYVNNHRIWDNLGTEYKKIKNKKVQIKNFGLINYEGSNYSYIALKQIFNTLFSEAIPKLLPNLKFNANITRDNLYKTNNDNTLDDPAEEQPSAEDNTYEQKFGTISFSFNDEYFSVEELVKQNQKFWQDFLEYIAPTWNEMGFLDWSKNYFIAADIPNPNKIDEQEETEQEAKAMGPDIREAMRPEWGTNSADEDLSSHTFFLNDYNWGLNDPNSLDVNKMQLASSPMDFPHIRLYEFQPNPTQSLATWFAALKIDTLLNDSKLIAAAGEAAVKNIGTDEATINAMHYATNISWTNDLIPGHWVAQFDVPYFGDNFIKVGSSDRWSCGNAFGANETLSNNYMLNVQDTPVWKFESYGNEPLSWQNKFYLINDSVEHILKNYRFLFAFVSGAFWVQSASTDYRTPNLYRINCPGRFAHLYAAMDVEVKYLGKTRKYHQKEAEKIFAKRSGTVNNDSIPDDQFARMIKDSDSCYIPEAFEVIMKVKDLTPQCFNVFAAYMTKSEQKDSFIPDVTVKMEGMSPINALEEKLADLIARGGVDQTMIENIRGQLDKLRKKRLGK